MEKKQAKWGKIPARIYFTIAFLILILFVMLFANHLAKHDPTEIDLLNKFAESSREYPFGTDDYGRCIFCRCLLAVRNSVGIAVSIELVSVIMGIALGMTAAYRGGVIDYVINMVSEALLSFPSVILIMLIVAFLGASTKNIILAILMVNWIWYTRISRSLTLTIKERKYVQAARLCGASSVNILIRHIFPGILSQMVAQFTMSLGSVILSLAGFSFLGIGIQRPTPELGVMISDGCAMIRTNFMVLFWPSITLFLIVLAFNILGDWVSEGLRGRD